MQGESEVFFQCPYCWETISMVFENYYSNQTYVEDCEVCCSPIEVSYKVNSNEEIFVEARSLND